MRTYGNKPTRFYSSKQETQASKLLGVKTQINSGATAFAKGDLVGQNCLLECKTLTKQQKSISVKKEWLDKLKEEAFSMNKQFHGLIFNFGPNTQNYVAIPIEDYNEFYQAYTEREGIEK